MTLKRQENERDVTLTISKETLVIPGSSPFTVMLVEVPDAVNLVRITKITPTVPGGGNTGSGNCASSGIYIGTSSKSYKIEIDTAGEIGVATFKWSNTNGATWQGTLIPIPDTDPITLEQDVDVAFAGGTGTDFQIGDYWTFEAQVWTEVNVIPTATKEYQVNYSTGKILFHSSDAGKTVYAFYEGRGSLCDGADVNQIIDVLDQGEVVLRMINTLGFAVRDIVAVLANDTYQKGNATDGTKAAIGFVKVVHATEGEVQLFGPMDGFSGLTPGTRYYLSTTPGAYTSTAPSGSGNIKQVVGRALSSTRMLVSISQEYVTV